MKEHKYEISAVYFPNYHAGDPHNEQWHGKGWSEWELVRRAGPRFAGHRMPKEPLWGYEDEADVAVMDRKIRTAVEYGITNMLFDWYWYEDGPFLNKPLDEAFLRCDSARNIRFSLLWANHDWTDIHPLPRAYRGRPRCELPWNISETSFFSAVDTMIGRYFSRDNYFRLNGGLFFCLYDLNRFVKNFGGTERAAALLAEMRRRVRAAGLGDMHINAVVWESGILCGEESMLDFDSVRLKSLGVDSLTSYVWVHEHPIDTFPSVPYAQYRKVCENDFDRLSAKYAGMAYYPCVTAGWDASPRTVQSDTFDNVGYPFSPVLTDNNPYEFEQALRSVKEKLDASALQTRMVVINAWNEWTEGSYLEPDTEHGYGRLEAVRRVFGAGNRHGTIQTADDGRQDRPYYKIQEENHEKIINGHTAGSDAPAERRGVYAKRADFGTGR